MSTLKEKYKQERFHEIAEELNKPEHTEEYLGRLLTGHLQVTGQISNKVEANKPVLSGSELAAIGSLHKGVFKKMDSETLKSKSVEYRTGLIIGIFIEGDEMIKRANPTAEEESMLQSFFISILGLGDEATEDAKQKLSNIMAFMRKAYVDATKQPIEKYDEAMKGYRDGRLLMSIGETPTAEIDDRTKINFLVLMLNRLDKKLHSVDEFEEFAKTHTKISFVASSEEFKKSCNLIGWTGAKYSRSKSKKKKADRGKKRSPVK